MIKKFNQLYKFNIYMQLNVHLFNECNFKLKFNLFGSQIKFN